MCNYNVYKFVCLQLYITPTSSKESNYSSDFPLREEMSGNAISLPDDPPSILSSDIGPLSRNSTKDESSACDEFPSDSSQ